MAKSYSFRADDALAHSLDALAAHEHKRRSEIIKEALRQYLRTKEKEAFKEESMRGRQDSLRVCREFEGTLDDNL